MPSDSLRISGQLDGWANDLRAEMITDLSTNEIGRLVAVALPVGLVGATGGVAHQAILKGGIEMTSMTTATAVSAGLKAKIAAGALAATLAAGGMAAVTGNLPDGAQHSAADFAARIGLELPRPDVSIDAGLAAGSKVSVDSLGFEGTASSGQETAVSGDAETSIGTCLEGGTTTQLEGSAGASLLVGVDAIVGVSSDC